MSSQHVQFDPFGHFPGTVMSRQDVRLLCPLKPGAENLLSIPNGHAVRAGVHETALIVIALTASRGMVKRSELGGIHHHPHVQ